MTVRTIAQAARDGGRALAALPSEARRAALHRVADALLARQEEILAANAQDVAAAERDIAAGKLSQALADRLPLSAAKLETLAAGMRSIADTPEPLGRELSRTELAPGLVLRKCTSPLGVLLVIFESRPDALPQIAALALRSGNGLVLKGGSEAAASNEVLHRVITEALAPDVPAGTIGLVHTREDIASLLELDDLLDLVIPRGSNALVRHIQQNTRIPVLGHADGICHVFVDAAADPDRAERIVVDSKTDYPAACNAMETLLLHRDHVGTDLERRLLDALRAEGVRLFGAHGALDLPEPPSLAHEYGDLAATVALVDDVQHAMDWVNTHGSGHTDSIVTEDADAARAWLSGLDSACAFHNASTRFADGYRFGLGAEVGISTGRIHARGPVGVEGLLTRQYTLVGQGDTVAPFSEGERHFTHRDRPVVG